MVGKATLAACQWIAKSYPSLGRYVLSGNMDTDKKHSSINMLLTRGRRVVAEAVIRKDILRDLMGVDTKALFEMRQISNAGAFLAGSSNNGSHTPNGLAAMFIATGQDVADISKSQAAATYSQLLDNGDYYWSVTLTSLIVGSVGGGTGLATQRDASRCSAAMAKARRISLQKSAPAWRSPAKRPWRARCSAATGCQAMSASVGITRRLPQLNRAKDRTSSRGVFAAVQAAQPARNLVCGTILTPTEGPGRA